MLETGKSASEKKFANFSKLKFNFFPHAWLMLVCVHKIFIKSTSWIFLTLLHRSIACTRCGKKKKIEWTEKSHNFSSFSFIYSFQEEMEDWILSFHTIPHVARENQGELRLLSTLSCSPSSDQHVCVYGCWEMSKKSMMNETEDWRLFFQVARNWLYPLSSSAE